MVLASPCPTTAPAHRLKKLCQHLNTGAGGGGGEYSAYRSRFRKSNDVQYFREKLLQNDTLVEHQQLPVETHSLGVLDDNLICLSKSLIYNLSINQYLFLKCTYIFTFSQIRADISKRLKTVNMEIGANCILHPCIWVCTCTLHHSPDIPRTPRSLDIVSK